MLINKPSTSKITMPKAAAKAPTTWTYTAKKGDTLGAIAAKYGFSAQKLAADNKIKNPDFILEGQKIKIPLPGADRTTPPVYVKDATHTHLVKTGENLTTIAKKHNVTIESLVRANGIKNPNAVFAGEYLSIPVSILPSHHPDRYEGKGAFRQ